MPRSKARMRSRTRLTAPLAALAVAATLAPAGCGGDDEGPVNRTDAEQEPPPAAPGEPSTAQPPPETAPDEGGGESGEGAGGDDSSEEAQEEAVAEDPETGPLPCPDVVITPDSGNGLFDVEANGLTCEDATAALEAWGASGFPGSGPPGFACQPVPGESSGRLSCEQEASGGVVEFTQGV